MSVLGMSVLDAIAMWVLVGVVMMTMGVVFVCGPVCG
jgi:hypothetical protein